jgi:hypothetical protein
MRKTLTIIFVLLINTLFAQLKPGNYSYKNADATLTFTIAEDGQTIKDCLIKGTNDISLVSLRAYRKAGSGEFIKNVVDPTKPTPYVGYYIVSGELPTYEIRIRNTPETVSILIQGVKLKSNNFTIE